MSNTPLANQLRALGVRPGDLLMVHSSFRSLGVGDPEIVIRALLAVLGEQGTLLMPALSYLQEPRHVHSTRDTPACVGFLPEYFRTRPGTLRSIHPTHSVCGAGAAAERLLSAHASDTTPCGPRSPFHAVLRQGGKILMLGCGLRPNTAMHAVEEYARPPYLFGPPITYTITDEQGRTFEKTYTPHDFAGYSQRYERVAGLLDGAALREGTIGQAHSHLIDGEALFDRALSRLREDPLAFVERAPLS